jgi:hypothetical protein
VLGDKERIVGSDSRCDFGGAMGEAKLGGASRTGYRPPLRSPPISFKKKILFFAPLLFFEPKAGGASPPSGATLGRECSGAGGGLRPHPFFLFHWGGGYCPPPSLKMDVLNLYKWRAKYSGFFCSTRLALLFGQEAKVALARPIASLKSKISIERTNSGGRKPVRL